MTIPDRRQGIQLAFGAAAVSGFAVFLNGYAVKAVPDATVFTTAKNLIAAAILVGLALAAPRPAHPRAPLPKVRLAAVAVVGGSVPFALFFEGLARAGSTQAAFIQKTLVVWVAILAVPLLAERVRGIHVAAIAALVVGQVVLTGGLDGFRFDAGAALILIATLLWSVEVVLAKRLLSDVPVRTVALARMAGGAAILVAWVAATGRWAVLAGLSATGWGWAAITGVILAAYVTLWFSALALAPAVDVTAVLVVAAIVTALLNIAVKGSPVTTSTATGTLILAAGAALIAVAASRPAEREVVRL